MKQFLNRNLQTHKIELTASTEREVEKLKAELRQLAYEREVVFARLHVERAEAVKSMYQKARGLSKSARRFAAREGVTTAEEFGACGKAVETAANELSQALYESRIFLPEKLCVAIQDHLHEVVGRASDILAEWWPPSQSDTERLSAALANKEKLEHAAWHLEMEIAAEFRKLLGVT